jgi:DHA3 family macrolide efflux protein-like MFS transporter
MDDHPSDQPLKNWKAPFFTVWTGQSFSLLGSMLVQFALIWWLTQTTHSATVLATASLVGMLPQVFIGPVAGALVDRSSRRLVMILADGLIALATVVLALLFLTGHVQVWQVYLLLFVRSAAGGFHWPAMTASTSLMVPKEHLSRIQGLNQLLGGGLNIVSAPLGALLLAALPMQGILSIDVSTALLAIIPLFFIPIPQPPRQPGTQAATSQTTLWQDLGEGLRYVWAWPGLVMIMIMATLINLVVTPGFTLMPILITNHFNGQALQLAWMESSWGIGVVAGGLLLSIWGGFHRRILTSLAGLVIMGVGIILLGLVPASGLYLAVGLVFAAGIGNPLANGPLMAVVQDVVAPEMQGRVFTLLGSVATAMSPLGLIVAGPVADALGVQTWFLIGGTTTLLIGLAAFFVPAIVHIEDNHRQASLPEQATPALATSPGD